jgi:hypothetical protein
LKIRSLFIEGVENTKTECILCGRNSPNKIRCENCPTNYYYDEQINICEKCPENTLSPKSSIGKRSCILERKCNISDGGYFLEYPYEKNSGNFLMKRYKYKINPLSICDKNDINENIFKNYEDILINKTENFCGNGLCLSNFNNNNINNSNNIGNEREKFVCLPCLGNK